MDSGDQDLCPVDILSTSALLHLPFSGSSLLESSHMPPSFSRHTFPLVNQIIPGCISKEIFNPCVCPCDCCTAAGILKQALGSWKKLKLDRQNGSSVVPSHGSLSLNLAQMLRIISGCFQLAIFFTLQLS